MQIVSLVFLLVYLPTSLVIYWKLCQTSRQKLWALCFFSYSFYAVVAYQFLPLLLSLSLLTFYTARCGYTKIGVGYNLVSLILFKYWGFDVESSVDIATTLGIEIILPTFAIILPLG